MSSDFDIKDSIMKIHPYTPGESKIDTSFPLRQLAANEAPLGPSPKAVEAAQDSLVTANRYPDGGAMALRAKISERFGFPAENLICGAGSDELISLICAAFADDGAEVLYSQHGFLMYKISALAADPGGCTGNRPAHERRQYDRRPDRPHPRGLCRQPQQPDRVLLDR